MAANTKGQSVTFKYALGIRARDRVTKFEGTITSRSQFLTGCDYYGIQPDAAGGNLPESNSFDEARIEAITDVSVLETEGVAADPGGPHDMPRLQR